MKNITLRLTEQQYALLEAYRLHLSQECGEFVSKQQLLYNLLYPCLLAAQEATE